MGKPTYVQKFRQEWKTKPMLKDWIQETDDASKVCCRYCKCVMQCKLWDLMAHTKTKKHTAAVGGFVQRNKIPFQATCLKTQRHEGALSLYFCQHGSIAPVDHLILLLKKQFQDSVTCQQIRLQRTKCSMIIKNVLAVHFKEDLLKDIGGSKCSLLLDESTDIAVIKFLGIAIIYYSLKQKKIVSTFLSLAEMSEANADSIVKCIKKELQKFGLDIKNVVGIGTDNASVMVGRNKGVYAQLKKEIPHLTLVRCVCHSIQLAINNACMTLLRNLEFLVQETYNWFSKSASRKSSYANLYKAINNDKEPLAITRACDTRWLSINTSITRILNQWVELETHFGIARLSEKCYNAEILYAMYKDPINYIYLSFLKPILADLNLINMSFQSKNSDPTKHLNDLLMVMNSLKNKICRIDEIFEIEDFEKHLTSGVFLGYQFETLIKKYTHNGNISLAKETEIRQRCAQFCIHLLKQLIQRLPENRRPLQNVDSFSVKNIFQCQKESVLSTLEYFGCTPESIEIILKQFGNINMIRWKNVSDTSSFWFEVVQYEDAAGNKPFAELGSFALQILCLPWSNADVERIFSQMNLVKSKLRNRLQIEMVNVILTVKYGLCLNNKCCFDYEIPEQYLKLIGTSEIYDINSNSDDCLDFIDL